MDGFLFNAIVYILAAIVCVPIAKRLGMGSVLGYLVAGILVGPYGFEFIRDETQGQDIMHSTEFGVVMMLFLIGLELEPKNLWKMRDLILNVGLTQVIVTSGLIFGFALALGIDWRISLAAGLSMALSSTAIVLQSLKEKKSNGHSIRQDVFWGLAASRHRGHPDFGNFAFAGSCKCGYFRH
ncbi:cation:proton antiporter [Algoriphagus boritolerans]|uniref:cation:proton antiporter domain-containing protein n=1 Tax=Algoriphagus boritolerans TaxID=308111 RepID=UPI000AF75F17